VNNSEEGSSIKIQLFYYYFTTSTKPLENEDLKIIVYSNSVLKYEEIIKTNQTGFVNINILPSIFNLKEGNKIFYVDVNVIFNGTSYLENRTMSLSFQIQNLQYNNNNSSFYYLNIFLLSILTALITSIGLKVYKHKKEGFKLIREITFKF
ncbi:unnamed protein product, partial [marine sediment metagenome]